MSSKVEPYYVDLLVQVNLSPIRKFQLSVAYKVFLAFAKEMAYF